MYRRGYRSSEGPAAVPGPETEPVEMTLSSKATGAARHAHDAPLVARAQSGDQGAFRQLFEAYLPLVHRIASRLADTPEEAADLTQDIFVRAWERLDSVRDGQAFQAWLTRLAVNLTCDAARRRRPRPLSLEALADDEGKAGWEACDPSQGCEQRLLEEELTARLQRALRALSPEHRAVILLHHLEGQPVEALAHHLGLPIGTIKSRLARARAELREQLRGYVEG